MKQDPTDPEAKTPPDESGRQAATREIALMLQKAVRKRYAPRDLIMREGGDSDVLYYILSGSVTVLVEDNGGEELILAYLGPGEFFGELGLFESKSTRSASVRARSDCEVALVTYARFRELITAVPELLVPLVGQIARRLRDADRKLGNLAFLDVTGRIARALLDLAADSQAMTHPEGMLVRIRRDELGRLVNCSRQTASEVLFALEQQGLIKMLGKSIIVLAESKPPAIPARGQ